MAKTPTMALEWPLAQIVIDHLIECGHKATLHTDKAQSYHLASEMAIEATCVLDTRTPEYENAKRLWFMASDLRTRELNLLLGEREEC
jgi:hypothetical protein